MCWATSSWQLIYVDNWPFIVRGTRGGSTVVYGVAFLRTLGYPFSAKRYKRGMQLDYISYYLDWVTFGVGISLRGAMWIKDFVDKLHECKGNTNGRFWIVLGSLELRLPAAPIPQAIS